MTAQHDNHDRSPDATPDDIPEDLLQLFHDCFWGGYDDAVAGGTGHERDIDWTRLVNGIEEFLKRHPTCVQGWCRLGDFFSLNSEPGKAHEYFLKALAIDPLHAEAAIEVAGYELGDPKDKDRIERLLKIGLENLLPGSEDEATLLSDVVHCARSCGFDDLARRARERGLKSYPDGYWPEA